MKKLILLTLISTSVALTACSKSTTEKDKAASQPVAASASAQASSPVAQDPVAVLKSDLAIIQQFNEERALAAEPLAKQLQEATQKKDKAAVEKLLPQLKAFTAESMKGLQALDIKSPEAQNLRTKIIAGSELGIQLNEEVLKAKPDEAKLKSLQEQVMKAQMELMQASQDIQMKIAPPASAPVASSAAASTPAKK